MERKLRTANYGSGCGIKVCLKKNAIFALPLNIVLDS
jgi:hypothetical protein